MQMYTKKTAFVLIRQLIVMQRVIIGYVFPYSYKTLTGTLFYLGSDKGTVIANVHKKN